MYVVEWNSGDIQFLEFWEKSYMSGSSWWYTKLCDTWMASSCRLWHHHPPKSYKCNLWTFQSKGFRGKLPKCITICLCGTPQDISIICNLDLFAVCIQTEIKKIAIASTTSYLFLFTCSEANDTAPSVPNHELSHYILDDILVLTHTKCASKRAHTIYALYCFVFHYMLIFHSLIFVSFGHFLF